MKQRTLRTLICLLLTVLLAAAALTGCNQSTASTEAPKTEARTAEAPQTQASATEAPQTEPPATEAPTTQAREETQAAPPETGEAPAPTELGEGGKLLYFRVTFSDGTTAAYAIRTDAETVGEALVSQGLVAGEESAYGLYVKTVCGETLDYNENGMYWAFYVGEDYAMTGVDATPITDGATYSFVAAAG